MPHAKDVKPAKWNSIKILFDNGEYSIITGIFDGWECLGERWNGGDEEIGFPSTRGHAQWHVVPEFLWISVLQGSLLEIERKPYKNSKEHKKEIVAFLSKILLVD